MRMGIGIPNSQPSPYFMGSSFSATRDRSERRRSWGSDEAQGWSRCSRTEAEGPSRGRAGSISPYPASVEVVWS